MRHKILTIILIFIIGSNYSFAADNDSVEKDLDTNIETVEDMSVTEEIPDLDQNTIIEKKSPLKRMALKRLIKKFNKDKISNKNLKPQRVNALIIIGFLLFLPGLILTLIGIALIPALVLVIVGGTLWILGLLKMRKSM